MAGADFSSVDEYLAAQPEVARDALRRVREAIVAAIPDADESISYKIPTYKRNGRVVLYFAGWKQHYSIYPASEALVGKFKAELKSYEVEKGTIRFSFDEPVPAHLISEIARFRAQEAAQKTGKK